MILLPSAAPHLAAYPDFLPFSAPRIQTSNIICFSQISELSTELIACARCTESLVSPWLENKFNQFVVSR